MRNQRLISLSNTIGEQVKVRKDWKHSKMRKNTFKPTESIVKVRIMMNN